MTDRAAEIKGAGASVSGRVQVRGEHDDGAHPPAEVTAKQLRELRIRLNLPEK